MQQRADHWDKVDWINASDDEIQQMIGCTRQRVQQVRSQRGLPFKYKNCSKYMIKFLRAKEKGELKGLNQEQAAKYLGIPAKYIRNKRDLRKNLTSHRLIPHDLMNYDLPNTDLSEIWELPFNLAANYRYKYKKGPAKWDLRYGHMVEDKEYTNSLLYEMKKASEYRERVEIIEEDSKEENLD